MQRQAGWARSTGWTRKTKARTRANPKLWLSTRSLAIWDKFSLRLNNPSCFSGTRPILPCVSSFLAIHLHQSSVCQIARTPKSSSDLPHCNNIFLSVISFPQKTRFCKTLRLSWRVPVEEDLTKPKTGTGRIQGCVRGMWFTTRTAKQVYNATARDSFFLWILL